MLLKYIGKRLLEIFPVLLGLSLLAFALGFIAPGDPAYFALANDSSVEPSQEELQQVRIELGLNDPFFIQYFRWLGRVLGGDLGRSYRTGNPIEEELGSRFFVSLNVAVWAIGFTLLLGIPIGLLGAAFHKRRLDQLCQGVAITLISIPGFWFGILFIFLFAEILHVLPSSGYGNLKQMILPSLVLASATIGITIRLTRASLLEELQKDYILTAYSAGIRKSLILWDYALPNSSIPIFTLLGSYLGSIIGGSVIVETLFALPGMGQYAVNGVLNRDFPVVQAYVLVSGVVYVFVHLLLDLSYIFLDPRIRINGEQGS